MRNLIEFPLQSSEVFDALKWATYRHAEEGAIGSTHGYAPCSILDVLEADSSIADAICETAARKLGAKVVL